MKIYLASDHAGFELKEKLKSYLIESGFEIKDFGAYEFNLEDDYPDFIIPAMRALEEDLRNRIESRAIIFGFSGQGEAMCANRFYGARAAVFYGGDTKIIQLSREHNDSNILSLGAGFLNEEEAKNALNIWLKIIFPSPNDYNSSRHTRRLEKLDNI